MMCHHWLSCCVSCFACLWLASFEWWSFPTRIISGLLTSSCFNSRIVYLTNFEERKINWSFRFYLFWFGLVFHGNDNRTKSCQKAKKQMLVEGRESPALLCVIIAPCFPKLEGVQGGHKKTLLTSFFFLMECFFFLLVCWKKSLFRDTKPWVYNIFSPPDRMRSKLGPFRYNVNLMFSKISFQDEKLKNI